MAEKKYKESTYFGMMRINGLSLFLNFSLFFSVIIFALVHLLITNLNFFSFDNYLIIYSDILTGISNISASVFGIVIAALAVTMSIFNQKILYKLEETKLLHKFLFPFWFLVSCWGILIIVSTFTNVIHADLIQLYQTPFHVYIAAILWLFIYSILMTINITGLLIRLFIQNSRVK